MFEQYIVNKDNCWVQAKDKKEEVQPEKKIDEATKKTSDKVKSSKQ